jgi:protein-disulfide isomerase
VSDAAITAMPDAALAAADHVLGDADAKLTLLEYGDCECPACIQAEPLMQHLVAPTLANGCRNSAALAPT